MNIYEDLSLLQDDNLSVVIDFPKRLPNGQIEGFAGCNWRGIGDLPRETIYARFASEDVELAFLGETTIIHDIKYAVIRDVSYFTEPPISQSK